LNNVSPQRFCKGILKKQLRADAALATVVVMLTRKAKATAGAVAQ
jgi:hypothetical protein